VRDNGPSDGNRNYTTTGSGESYNLEPESALSGDSLARHKWTSRTKSGTSTYLHDDILSHFGHQNRLRMQGQFLLQRWSWALQRRGCSRISNLPHVSLVHWCHECSELVQPCLFNLCRLPFFLSSREKKFKNCICFARNCNREAEQGRVLEITHNAFSPLILLTNSIRV